MSDAVTADTVCLYTVLTLLTLLYYTILCQLNLYYTLVYTTILKHLLWIQRGGLY